VPPPPPPRLRADAQRNYERLLAVAEVALDTRGTDAALDDIARAANVGSATLYRHFPTRAKLIEAVYARRIDALCATATELAAREAPGDALVGWLRAVVAHVNASRMLADAFDAAHRESAEDADGGEGEGEGEAPQVAAWHRAVREAAAPLLHAAQAAGRVRPDLDAAELVALTTAVARAGTPAQAARFLDLLLDGLTATPA
jgi:AcrR family transcriptional regulator